MLLFAVTVLVVAQLSSEIPEGLVNYPVLVLIHLEDSASNRNEYQEYFLGVKAAGA
jgi:hypothetical protein